MLMKRDCFEWEITEYNLDSKIRFKAYNLWWDKKNEWTIKSQVRKAQFVAKVKNYPRTPKRLYGFVAIF